MDNKFKDLKRVMRSFLRISVLILVVFSSLQNSYATTYYACGTGITWDGSTSFIYTSSNCTTGGPFEPSSKLVAGDVLVIQPGAKIMVVGNQSISVDITITLYGTLFMHGSAVNGKLSLTTNSTIQLETGSFIGCSDDGSTAVPCGNSDQIGIGSQTYKGAGIDAANSAPKPTTMTSGGLPIELISFEASKDVNKISLNWSTTSELNFDYFNLEKSSNGKDFSSIANVKGHGTTNERHNYSFEDNFPLIGKNYYRLTSVDFDNYREEFKVIVQDYSGEKNFQVSPNPSDGKTINVHFNFDANEGQIVIYDNMGLIVESFQIDKTGKISFANSLNDGIYFAKYSSPSFTKAIRFLVKQ